MEEGRGFRLDNAFGKIKGELGRLNLRALMNYGGFPRYTDFMPYYQQTIQVIIITDWYSENQNEAIKVTLRFLSNEVRSDAIDIKIFYRKCKDFINCTISENQGNLEKELKKKFKKAAIYQKQKKIKILNHIEIA